MTESKQNEHIVFSAGITAEPLLFKELKFLISYLDEKNITEKKEIYKKVLEENIFQYKSPKSSLRRLNPLFKRYSVLSQELRKIVLNGNLQDAIIVSLFALYRTNPLFAEFFDLVITEKFKVRDFSFADKDIYTFFSRIEIEHHEVSEWKDYTKKKIVQVITKILKEAMILNSSKSLQKCSLTPDVKQLLINEGGNIFVDIIELK